MKRILWAPMVCLHFLIYAQNENVSADMFVRLHDGSTIIGLLIEMNPIDVTMVMTTGDTLTIEREHIKKLFVGRGNTRFLKNARFHYTSGDYLNLGIGFSASNFDASSHIHLLVGRRYSDQSSFGFGTGWDVYTGGIAFETYSFWNLYGHGRYYLSKNTNRRTRPYASIKIGYGIPENKLNQWFFQVGTYRGGLAFSPSFGLHLSSRKKMKIQVSWSLQGQYSRANYRTAQWWSQGTVEIKEKNLFLRSGISVTFEWH